MKITFRNLCAYILIGVMIVGSISPISARAASSSTAGDVNSDGVVDVKDLIRLKRYCESENVSVNMSEADWNGDAVIDSNDVARLRAWLVNPSTQNEPIGLPNIFSSGNGTLTVTDTNTFPTVAFSNSNNQTSYIDINDSVFVSDITMYDSICFKVKFTTSGWSVASGVSVSVVTENGTVIKAATSMTKNSWLEVCLNQQEMDMYRTQNNGLRIKLDASKSSIIGSYKYELELKDFHIADEMNRFSCATSSVTYGVMSDAVDMPTKTYPYTASCYTNDRWQRWSFITINDADFKDSITKYDTIEFDVMLKTPTTGEFDSVQMDLLCNNEATRLQGPFLLKYDEWLHISLSPNDISKYISENGTLKLRLTVNGGSEDTNYLQMGYELYINNFRFVKNGNKDCFNNAEQMFTHWYQKTEEQTWFSANSNYGTISQVNGPIYNREGERFTKFANSQSSRWSFININDELFKNELTAEDSIRFYVYAEKNTGFDATNVTLALVGNSESNSFKGDTEVPFGQWTMVTMTGTGVQKYLDANNGMRIRTTVRPDDAGSNMSFTLYLSDIQIVKLANKDLNTDIITSLNSTGTVVSTTKTHGTYSGAHVNYINGTGEAYARIKINDDIIKNVIEPGDALEFWMLMEPNNDNITAVSSEEGMINGGAGSGGTVDFGELFYNGTGKLWLSSLTNETAFGTQTDVKQSGGGWVKVTLDANGVQNYLDANNGLRICINMTDCTYLAYNLYIGELAVVKNVELKSSVIAKDPLEVDASRVHGTYDSVSAKYVNGYWDAWTYIAVDDSKFKNTITKYDAIEFWAYVTGGQTTVDTISLGVVSENQGVRIKDNVTLKKDGWTQIKLTPKEVATYISNADGMKLIITAEGTNVSAQGGTDYTIYIDEFRVIKDGYYDEVVALEKYSCTSSTGTFAIDYDMVRGTNNRCSAAYTNHQDMRRSFITIDDSSFKGEVSENTVIEFWAHLEPTSASGCDYSSVTLAVGTNHEEASILGDTSLTFNEWTKISLSGDAITKYLAKQDGMGLRLTVNGGTNMTYTMYLEDFRVVQPSDGIKGSLSEVTVYTASSSDKVLQDEDCSYLGSDFALIVYRNEYESGQLILTSDVEVSGFSVSATDFECGGATLKAELFEIYTEYYHKVDTIYDTESEQTTGMYPDALIPMRKAVEFGLNNIPEGQNQGIWIAIKIPETQKAGLYTGSFLLTLGNQKKVIPAQITVVDYTLPNTISLQSCIPIQGAYISATEKDSPETMYTKYVDLLNKFRLSGQYVSLMSTDPYGSVRGREEALKTLPYAQKESCSSYAIRVVETEHDTYGYVLNQSLFEAYLKAYIDVSIENNVDLFKKAYVYMGNICDEPTGGLSDERANCCAQQFNNAVANAVAYLEQKTGEATFKAQLKTSLSRLQNVVTADKRDTLSNVNTYCPTIDAFDSASEIAKRKEEGNYWWYTCTVPKIPYPTYHIDDEAASARIMGWLAKESGVKGYLTWEMAYAKDTSKTYLKGVDLYDNVHRWGDAYGDGFLVYPGRIFDIDGPVESLRLYAMGDGLEDFEALTDLEKMYQSLSQQYNTAIAADGIMDYMYNLMADNTRCYGDGSDIMAAREILTQLLLLAKEGTAISNFYIEDGKAHYKLVKATGEEDCTYTLSSATTYDFATSNFTKTDNVTVTSGDKESVAVTVSGLTEYSVTCDVSNAGIANTTDNMYMTIYNDSSETVTIKVYSNKTEYLDGFVLKPGKNVLSFVQMQELKWFARKGMTSILFKVNTPSTNSVELEFGTITKGE